MLQYITFSIRKTLFLSLCEYISWIYINFYLHRSTIPSLHDYFFTYQSSICHTLRLYLQNIQP